MSQPSMFLLPPKPGTCPICATAHNPADPHKKDSLYYQMRFHLENGRSATWVDAMAHGTEEVKQIWIQALALHGIRVPADDQ